jgi:hypothetical protein
MWICGELYKNVKKYGEEASHVEGKQYNVLCLDPLTRKLISCGITFVLKLMIKEM